MAWTPLDVVTVEADGGVSCRSELFRRRYSCFRFTVAEAAERLGVSDRRVRALIDSGRLRAQRLGRIWMIEPTALGSVEGERSPGRPLSAEAAWSELLGDRDAPVPNPAVLRSRYRGRSARLELDGPDMAAALADADVRIGCWAAGLFYDDFPDEDPSKYHAVYIGASSYGPWLNRHWLVPSSAPRVLAHVVEDPIFGALSDRHNRFVAPCVVAVDLAELGGARPIDSALRIWNRWR